MGGWQRLAALAAVALVLVAWPSAAQASTCPEESQAQRLERAEVIFEGVAEDGPTQDGRLFSPATFRVTRYLKGSGPERQRVTTGLWPRPTAARLPWSAA